MLSVNLCVPYGLFNGATGKIVEIIQLSGKRPENSLPDAERFTLSYGHTLALMYCGCPPKFQRNLFPVATVAWTFNFSINWKNWNNFAVFLNEGRTFVSVF
jgi:hypothetical protein